MNHDYSLLPEYNKQIKINDQDFLAFSKSALKKHTNGQKIAIVGEIKKEKTQSGTDFIVIGSEKHNLKPPGSHSSLLYKKSAYVSIGGNRYVAVLKNRVPFLIILLILLAGIIVSGLMLWSMLKGGNDVPVIAPDHPLPEVDSNIEEIVGDNDTPNSNISEGGGAVSMIYTLDATINLADNNIDIMFKNPAKSNHDVALELYITKNGERTLISKSGRIPAGNLLRSMTLNPDAAVLSEGVYQGVYKVVYYNPQTGERALIESDITDVTITVKQ